uniref:Very-long-chain (3R)-3-hydroxyacyl-CoA dehydratase n=1 Tax=Oryza glumipatula TaxID=40148 RepID=A0A0D9Y3A8_9ORYZ
MAADGSMVRRLYLSIYNWVAFIGWAQVLCYMILALLDKGHEAVYAAIERPLLFTQTAAILEVLVFPSSLPLFIRENWRLRGLLRSPVSSTLPQITGRLFITWGILWSFPETQSYIFVTSLLICWCIIEVTRYSFYGMKESFGFTPSWLLWLRYSTFIACFPVGVVSEICLAYTVLPFMKASEKYCLRMPNKWNFSFNYFYANVFFMALYVPVVPYLFHHMIAQRKKALSKAKTT